MRALLTAFVCGIALFGVASCSRPATPPVGRWEGTYDSPDVMIAVRLEITQKGEIFLCAPDLTDIGNVPADQRGALRQRLSDGLAAAWGDAQPRPMEFDGRVFRKPDGVAPQMEWNPDTKQMTVILYLGTRPSVSVPMRAVGSFSDNPWPT